jgi:hypothetical protein
MPVGKTALIHRPRRVKEQGPASPAAPAASSGPGVGGRTRRHHVRYPRQGLRSPAATVPMRFRLAPVPQRPPTASFRGSPPGPPDNPKSTPQTKQRSGTPSTLTPSITPKGGPGDKAGGAATTFGSYLQAPEGDQFNVTVPDCVRLCLTFKSGRSQIQTPNNAPPKGGLAVPAGYLRSATSPVTDRRRG